MSSINILDKPNVSASKQNSLISAHLVDIKKDTYPRSWNNNMENIVAGWGEKAAGLRFMHLYSSNEWTKFANRLTISSILVTSFASTISLIATSVDDTEIKNGILFGVTGIGLISTLIQSFKKFYNAEEKAADHASVSKQYASFYRDIKLQMTMFREHREDANILTARALKEYERLQQEAPNLSVESINAFKRKFSNSKQTIPDIANDEFIINIAKNNVKTKDTDLQSDEIELL